MKSILRYMGGKSYIADWIVSKFPRHRSYVEVFGGGASVLLKKSRSKIEIYNDLWEDVVVFFRVLRDKPEDLREYLYYVPYSRVEFKNFLKKFVKRDFKDDVERAATIYVVCNFSVNAIIGQDFSMGTDRWIDLAKDHKNKMYEISKFAERFRGVTIENLDFEELIRKYDREDTLFYCDPPYLGRGKKGYYIPNFNFRDHYRLAKTLNRIKGLAAVSYYPHNELEDLYPTGRWRYLRKQVVLQSSIEEKGSKRPRRTELLILNYDPPKFPVSSQAKKLTEVFG